MGSKRGVNPSSFFSFPHTNPLGERDRTPKVMEEW